MTNNTTSKTRVTMLAAIIGIVFVVYNVILFAVGGIYDHYAAFWISYIFVIITFGVVCLTGYLLKNRRMQPHDWLLGYPVLKHTTIYVAAELVVSTIFILLDQAEPHWAFVFIPQLLILAIYAIFAISCFMAQDIITEIDTKVKDATSFIKLLQVDAEMVAEKSSDAAVKAAFKKLAEDIRFSDPMSNPNLFELEKQITLQVSNADTCITLNDIEGALSCCNRASMLLLERNKKCKALK